MTFFEYLVKHKKLKGKKAKEIEVEMQKTGKPVDEVILERRLMEEEELFRLKSSFLEVPLKEKVPEKIPSDVLSIIPQEAVDFYKMIPLSLNRQTGVLEVAMTAPEDTQAQQALKFLSRQQKLDVKVFLITFSAFRKCLAKFHLPEIEITTALEKLEKEGVALKGPEAVSKEEFARLVEEAPVVKMVAVILRQAVEGNASDIHIEPTKSGSRVRFRFDGVLYSSLTLPANVQPAIVARIKILSSLKIDETRKPQDGRFTTMIGGKMIDFRVATFPTTQGEKVVLRVLDPEEGLKSIDKLGLSGHSAKLTEEAIKRPYGMILVTGPTGSGKSTTLYTLLGMLNKEAVNIVTLEDPVEYYMPGISQSQVLPVIGYTFANGLRQILRQDPDIIMVGEIRDEETANLAIHAALTGHLVLSTLHTNNAPGAVPRLIDMGIEPFLIPPALSLIISQRLLRKLCPYCKEKKAAQGEAKKFILKAISQMPPKTRKQVKLPETLSIFQAKGCKKCNQKGYSGRIGVFEVLKLDEAMAKIVNERGSEQQIGRAAREQGMVSLVEDGILKVLDGVTSLEEVMRITV